MDGRSQRLAKLPLDGLIISAEHCRDALRAGAWGVSTSDPRLWHLDVGLTEPSSSRKSLIGTG